MWSLGRQSIPRHCLHTEELYKTLQHWALCPDTVSAPLVCFDHRDQPPYVKFLLNVSTPTHLVSSIAVKKKKKKKKLSFLSSLSQGKFYIKRWHTRLSSLSRQWYNQRWTSGALNPFLWVQREESAGEEAGRNEGCYLVVCLTVLPLCIFTPAGSTHQQY